MTTETDKQAQSRRLMAEVNALQNKMKADGAAKKVELDKLIAEINQLQLAAIKERDTGKAKVVKAKTKELFETQVAHLASKQNFTKQQIARLAKAREGADDARQQQQLDGYIKKKKEEFQQLSKEVETIYQKAKQKSISIEDHRPDPKPAAKGGDISMARAKAEAEKLIGDVKAHRGMLSEHITATSEKADEAKRLITEIKGLQEAAEKGTLTQREVGQIEERVTTIESRQKQNREEINQLTQAKIKYELALAKAREDRMALQQKKLQDEQLKDELNVLIEEKEAEQRQLMEELEAMRLQAEQEAAALKAQRDAARALAEKQAEDGEVIGAEKSKQWMVLAGSVTGVLVLVLALYFLTPLPELVRERIKQIQQAPQPVPVVTAKPEPAPEPKPEAAPEPVQLRPLGFYRNRLKDGAMGPFMVKLPGATFTMGSDSAVHANEGPPVPVTLKAFSISKYEITFEQYERFVRDTGVKTPDDNFWGGRDRPVINVTWRDAVAYAKWLTTQTGYQYRLPSEREWEFAATVGINGGGVPTGRNRANCNGCGSEWDNRMTAPVGSFTANDFDLHDLIGNVMEWTVSCYHENYQEAPGQAQIWEGGDCSRRIVRGSAFNTPVAQLRPTRRLKYKSDDRRPDLGFRVVRVE